MEHYHEMLPDLREPAEAPRRGSPEARAGALGVYAPRARERFVDFAATTEPPAGAGA